MKRLFSTFCLLVGASVASYAGIINTNTSGNLLGPSAVLMDFGSPATFPVTAFTSLPSGTGSGTSNSSVGITVTGGSSSSPNSGNQVRVNAADASLVSFFGSGVTGNYLSTYNGAPGTSTSSTGAYAKTLMLTFAAPVTGFTINYVASNAGNHQFTVAGLAGSTSLADQSCSAAGTCATSVRTIGYQVDSGGPISSFSSVTFTFGNGDTNGFGDDVLFDNIRTVLATATSGSSSSTPSTNGGGEIPEPSTYALMGAGLLALGYARRKK